MFKNMNMLIFAYNQYVIVFINFLCNVVIELQNQQTTQGAGFKRKFPAGFKFFLCDYPNYSPSASSKSKVSCNSSIYQIYTVLIVVINVQVANKIVYSVKILLFISTFFTAINNYLF